MICQRCLFRMQRPSLGRAAGSLRTYALKASANNAVSPPNPAKPRGPATETHEGHPAATSSTAAQPFSAREGAPGPPGRSPEEPRLDPSGSVQEIESLPRVKSSVPGGQPLRGLGYFKDKEGPVALEDDEYPPWLWTLLDNGKKGNTDDAAALDGNVFSKSKAQRKKAAKAALKAAKNNPGTLLPQIPIDHQSIDLPSGDGSVEGAMEAGTVRAELQSAMRQRRRKSIKEANYLKSMD